MGTRRNFPSLDRSTSAHQTQCPEEYASLLARSESQSTRNGRIKTHSYSHLRIGTLSYSIYDVPPRILSMSTRASQRTLPCCRGRLRLCTRWWIRPTTAFHLYDCSKTIRYLHHLFFGFPWHSFHVCSVLGSAGKCNNLISRKIDRVIDECLHWSVDTIDVVRLPIVFVHVLNVRWGLRGREHSCTDSLKFCWILQVNAEELKRVLALCGSLWLPAHVTRKHNGRRRSEICTRKADLRSSPTTLFPAYV